jgi:hypothetical protein
MTDTLARAAATSFDDYSARLVADAVNELLEHGRDGALRMIRSAATAAPPPPDATGLLWVMRALFELPEGTPFPRVRLGSPSPPAPPDAGTLPRFPIVIAAGAPLLAVRGYDLGGLPQGVEPHLEYYAAYGAVRSGSLIRGEDAEREFGEAWRRAYAPDDAPPVLDLIRAQLRR